MDKGFQTLKIVLLGALSILIPLLIIYQSSTRNGLAKENCSLQSQNTTLLRERSRSDSIVTMLDSLVKTLQQSDSNEDTSFTKGKVFGGSSLTTQYSVTRATNSSSTTSTIEEEYELTAEQTRALYNWIVKNRLKKIR